VFDHASPRDALAGGIGMVFQERLAFPNLSVAANIFAGREITRAGGRLDHGAMRARTNELLKELRVPIGPDDPMEHVSAANAQLVQVARALAFDCRVLVLDEPTAALTDAEVAHLFKILDGLRSRGVTVLFVSHRLPEVFRLCQRITVLRDGLPITVLHPEKRNYWVARSTMTEAGISTHWNMDLFVALGEDLGAGRWSIRAQLRPLIDYVWLAAGLMALGGALAASDRRYRARRNVEDAAAVPANAAEAT
jgi:ABC-type sugar transport system ATPase subunit